MDIEELKNRLRELHIDLPEAPKPLAAYVPASRTRELIYTSGQLPMVNGKLVSAGKVGATISIEEAKAAARVCAVNCLSAAVSVLEPLESIEQVLKLSVFVNSADGFTGQPEVANGASELMLEVFGEKGKHARAAVGVAELPRDASVEVEMIVTASGTLPY
jgi:enamine deaminase RidA (YjgF/YER057c/UK114 family)